MTNLEIHNRLEELGFILKVNLKFGLNRVSTQQYPNQKNGWIYLKDKFVNFGSWSEDIESGYFFTQELSNESRARNVVKSDAYIEQEKLEKEQKIQQLEDIRNKLAILKPIINHPYLEYKKSLSDPKLRCDEYMNLVIPSYNIDKKIMGYQTISHNGDKFFRPGTILKGSFFPILENGIKLEDANLILLAEGYSTASSIFQAMQLVMSKCAVIVCFSVCNIDYVAKDFIKHYNVPILTIKDNDSPGYMPVHIGFTVGNLGEDANDVHCKRGLEKLKEELIHNLRFIKIG